jgi:hypothetical protein
MSTAPSASVRRWQAEQRARSRVKLNVPELLYCGHCGRRATATAWGSGVLVRCPKCGTATVGTVVYCALDGQRLAGHDRCHVCTQLTGRAHHHPAGVCLPRANALARVATR